MPPNQQNQPPRQMPQPQDKPQAPFQGAAPLPQGPAQPLNLYSYDPNKVRKMRILVGGGIVLLVLAVLILFFTLRGRGGSAVEPFQLSAEATYQIQHISNLALESDRTDSDTKDLAAVAKALSISNINELNKLTSDLYSAGIDIKGLEGTVDASLEERITKAIDTDTVARVYPNMLDNMIKDVNNQLKLAYAETKDERTRVILDNMYKSNERLAL